MVERRQAKRYLAYLASLTAAGAGLTPVIATVAGTPAAQHGTSVRPAVAPAAQLALTNAAPRPVAPDLANCEWGESWGESWSDSWGDSWGESCGTEGPAVQDAAGSQALPDLYHAIAKRD